jgi:hypothetical protein
VTRRPPPYEPDTVTSTEFEVITVPSPSVYVAYTVVLPPESDDSTHIGSMPFSTVIRLVSGVFQVTVVVTSISPGCALAVRQLLPLAVELIGTLIEVGETRMLVMFERATVAVAVAVAVPEDAVMVAVPTVTPFSSPPVLMVAMLGVPLDQHTVVPVQLVPAVRVSALPLLSVPAAVICCVCPIPTVGADGSIVIAETVGLTKNPVQLAASASINSTAHAPVRRSFL